MRGKYKQKYKTKNHKNTNNDGKIQKRSRKDTNRKKREIQMWVKMGSDQGCNTALALAGWMKDDAARRADTVGVTSNGKAQRGSRYEVREEDWAHEEVRRGGGGGVPVDNSSHDEQAVTTSCGQKLAACACLSCSPCTSAEAHTHMVHTEAQRSRTLEHGSHSAGTMGLSAARQGHG